MVRQCGSNQAICQRLFLSPKTVEAYARSPFTKLGPDVGPNDNRRVLAVLALSAQLTGG